MAKTESSMIDLGTTAPDFSLIDVVSEKTVKFADIQGEHGTLVMFICNHCPFVIHVQNELINIGRDYKEKGLGIVAISSNDVKNYPEDAPEKMKARAIEKNFPFSYLYDESQKTAKAYQATCTPDFFLFSADQKLVYRGQLDDSRPGNGLPVTGIDLRTAINCLLRREQISSDQKPSIGCNIKWK